ncbi:MAG: hypothetical protein QM778_10920 [Myxococcales bacterium]
MQERDLEGPVESPERGPSRPRLRTQAADGGSLNVESSASDDEQARDFVVPRGTFASEVPPQPSQESHEAESSSRREEAEERPLAARGPEGRPSEARAAEARSVELRAEAREAPHAEHARESATSEARSSTREARISANESGPVKVSKSSHSSQRLRVARAPERPPYLASEILREDIAPREPGRNILAAIISVAAIAGLIGVLVAGLHTVAAIALALLFMALFGVGRLKLAYTTRATAVAALSGVALVVIAWTRHAGGGSASDLLLAIGTPLLAGSLYVRSWYRGSIAARTLVGLSLVPSCLWAFLTSHRELLSLEFIWQSWLPALTWYVFVILCLLALLAFMGDETTGGCTAWALGLCGWYAGYAGVRFALEVDTSGPLRTLGLAEPALIAPLAVALAQLVSHVVGRRTRRHTQVLASG